jgi:hypothetical protein
MDAVMIDDMPDGGVDMLRVGFVERTCRVEHA